MKKLLMMLALLAVPAAAQTAPSSSSSSSAPPDRCQVLVLDLEAQGLAASEGHVAAVLTEALASSVAEVSGCEVITRREIATMLDVEADRMACGNESDSCLSEIGNALGVDQIVAGSVARLGTGTTVSARLMNMKAGKVIARAEGTAAGDNEFRSTARAVGARLFGKDASALSSSSGPGALTIVGGALGGLGVIAVVGSTLLWTLPADTVFGTPAATTAEKNEARTQGTQGLIVGGIGAVAILVGTGLVIADVATE